MTDVRIKTGERMAPYNVKTINTVLERTASIPPQLTIDLNRTRVFRSGKGLSMFPDQFLPGGGEGFGPGYYLPSVRFHERFSACL